MEALLGTLAHLAASYSEPDRVLSTIVRSTARLLGTDAAHVMLVDAEQGILRVKTAHGITSKRFYDATCRVDELLPGAAIRTRSVVCVRDMREHEQAIHYRTEGVRTVMCAPMFVEDELLGVLMAAHRTVYEPSTDDVALMAALAGAAAVAIANARLHADRERSIERLGELNRLLAERSEALERTLGFQRAVTSRVLQGRGLADVVETAAASARATLVVVDRDLTPLHPVTTPLADLGLDLDTVAVRARGAARRQASPTPEWSRSPARGGRCASSRCRSGPSIPAFVLVVPDGDDLDAADLGIVDAAVTAIGLELLRDRATAEAEARVTGGVFQALLSDEHVDEATVLRRAAYLGYELGADNGVLAVRPALDADAAALGRTEAMVRRAVRRTARPTAVFERDNVVYAVVAAGTSEDLTEQCRLVELEALTTGNGLTVHIAHAGPHRGVPGLRNAVREAHYALHVQTLAQRTGRTTGFDDLGIWALLGRVGDREQLAAFAEGVLGRLLDYDRDRGSDLIHTLRHLARCSYHYRTAADELFAHPNTLRYRVARITELTGLDLADPEDRLRIELALRVLDVLSPPKSGGGGPADARR